MRSERDEREGRLLATMINMLTASASDPSRLNRGRTYARQGAVVDLFVEPGTLTASVQGSRSQPYEVIVHVAGAESFDNRTVLVPERDEIRFTCTCPDWDDPCKHAVAVMVTFAEQISHDPAMLVRWRGGQRLDHGPRAVVGSRAGSAPAPAPEEPGSLDDGARLALIGFLGSPADIALEPVGRLRPPAAAWGELWAEMLADALDALSGEPAPPR